MLLIYLRLYSDTLKDVWEQEGEKEGTHSSGLFLESPNRQGQSSFLLQRHSYLFPQLVSFGLLAIIQTPELK